MENPARMAKRCKRDLELMTKQYADLFIPELINGQINLWHVTFRGAPNTLYHGETFK